MPKIKGSPIILFGLFLFILLSQKKNFLKPMKKYFYVFLLSLIGISCERPIIPDIEMNYVPLEALQGGWGRDGIDFRLSYSPALGVVYQGLPQKLRNMLEERSDGVSLFFLRDTLCCIQSHDDGFENVRSYSHIDVRSYPAAILPENKEVLCDIYTDSFFVKMEYSEDDTTAVFYLKRKEVMKVIEEDGYVSSSAISLIDKIVEDAYFELRMKRTYLKIYDELKAMNKKEE